MFHLEQLSNRTGYRNSLTGNTCLYSQVSTFPLVQYLLVLEAPGTLPTHVQPLFLSTYLIYVLVQYSLYLLLEIRILLRFTFLTRRCFNIKKTKTNNANVLVLHRNIFM